jgi:hypothetical protein
MGWPMPERALCRHAFYRTRSSRGRPRALRFTSATRALPPSINVLQVVKEGAYRLASLEVGSVFTPSSGILLAEPSDSFVERFAGTRVIDPASFVRPSESSWVVQLIGDESEAIALSRFRQMQNKHKAILGTHRPLVVSTTPTPGAPPIWTRIRVGMNSREAAESLCAQLESAGERCVVQRNMQASSSS